MNDVIVSRIVDETKLVKIYELKNVDGKQFSQYEPGSHIDVRTPSGIIRQYSLCGDPGDLNVLIIAVKREQDSRGGSLSMHDSVKLGDKLQISTPRCLFSLSAQAERHILIGAGIGITPILSMAHKCSLDDASYEVHYFAHDLDHAPFHGILSQFPFKNNVSFHLQIPQDEIAHSIDGIICNAAATDCVYVCGPAAFMELTASIAQKYLPLGQIRMESFRPREQKTSNDNKSFSVSLAYSGKKCTVSADESLVDALTKIGVEIPTSCCEGICGTCLVPVISGDIDHRDSFLTAEEIERGEMMCACVSRATSEELTLDL